MRSPNFGCSMQNNLAAMIGDPRDLVEPAAMTAPDAAIRVRGVKLFREGQVTSSETDGDVEQRVAN
jgi:pilus assembly protein CpaD